MNDLPLSLGLIFGRVFLGVFLSDPFLLLAELSELAELHHWKSWKNFLFLGTIISVASESCLRGNSGFRFLAAIPVLDAGAAAGSAATQPSAADAADTRAAAYDVRIFGRLSFTSSGTNR